MSNLLLNASADGNGVLVRAGNYTVSVSGTFGGTTAALFQVINGADQAVAGASFTAAGQSASLALASGVYKMKLTGGTPSNMNASLQGLGANGNNFLIPELTAPPAVMPTLQPLTLPDTVAAGLAAGTVLGPIGNRLAGSELVVNSPEGYFAKDGSDNLIVGLNPPSSANGNMPYGRFPVEVIERKDGVTNPGGRRSTRKRLVGPAQSTQPIFTQAGKWYLASNRTRSPVGSALPNAPANVYMLSEIYLGDNPYSLTDIGVVLPSHFTSNSQSDNEFAAEATFDIQGVSIGFAPRTSDYAADRAAAAWQLIPYNGVAGQNAVVIDPTVNPVGVKYHGALTIPKNSRIWAKVQFHGAGKLPYTYEPNTTIGEGQAGSATDSLGAKLLDGSATNTSGRIASQLYGPEHVFAKGTDGRPVHLTIGNSIGQGKNEILLNSGPVGGVGRGGAGGGFISRGMNDNLVSAQFLGSNICIPGSGPFDPATNGRIKTAKKWDAIALITALNGGTPPFSHIICEHGTNSLNNMPGFRDDIMKPYWALVRAEWPGIPIAQTTMICKATTSDGYQTLSGQTVSAIDQTTGARFIFNDDLIATRCQGAVESVINTYQYTSDPTQRDKWAIQSATATLAAALAAGAYGSFTVNENVLAVGDFVSLDVDVPGTAGAGGAGAHITAISTGSAPYTVTLNTPITIANALGIGAKVKPHLAADNAGLHPGTTSNVRTMKALTDWKNTIWKAAA